MVAIRGGIAMAFFKRDLSPVERFEQALKDKQAARRKLAARVGGRGGRGAANTRLDRAEAAMRAVEDRARTLRAELADVDEHIVSAERALAEAQLLHERNFLTE